MMRRELLHIWGPFSVYSYGLAIALGLVVFVFLCLRNKTCQRIISTEKFIETVGLGLLAGLVGARLLYLLNSWHRMESVVDVFALWSGGLSVLGGIIAILLVIPWYLKYIKVPVLPLLDVAALNAPLLHAISRLGCFMAGCCYGKPASVAWAITYTDIDSEAPLNIPLHPTQLYTALLLLLTFFVFRYGLQKKVSTPGVMLMIYLMAESAIRFSMDYVRDDIEYFPWDTMRIFSEHQWISVGMFCMSLLGVVILQSIHKKQVLLGSK
jgi:phosphatidylglycerol:prolipoprotein diacylglycerol transferase